MAHILVIDDDAGFREYLSVLLERAGHTVRTLSSGVGAAREVTEGGFDAVLTDLYMPGADGIETMRTLRAVAPDVPVICLSGKSRLSSEPCLRIMQVLGATLLEKPTDRAELLATLDRLLAARRAGVTGARC